MAQGHMQTLPPHREGEVMENETEVKCDICDAEPGDTSPAMNLCSECFAKADEKDKPNLRLIKTDPTVH